MMKNKRFFEAPFSLFKMFLFYSLILSFGHFILFFDQENLYSINYCKIAMIFKIKICTHFLKQKIKFKN